MSWKGEERGHEFNKKHWEILRNYQQYIQLIYYPVLRISTVSSESFKFEVLSFELG
jgi:hypothetical protein